MRLRHLASERAGYPEVDCRFLFVGPRLVRLREAFTELVQVMSGQADPEAVKQSLTNDPLLREFYEVHESDSKLSARLHDSMFAEQSPLEDLELTLSVENRSRLLSRSVRPERLRAVGLLLALLRGGTDDGGVRISLRRDLDGHDSAWVEALLDQLLSEGLVVNDTTNRAEHHPGSGPAITFLGHASVLFRTCTSAVLFDPLVRPDLGSPRRILDVPSLELDAIVCSHSHWDHCNLESLLLFDKAVPVIVPRVHVPTAFNPPMAPVLRMIGFVDIREVDPGESVIIGDIEVISTPFHGEQDEPGAVIDHFTYVVRSRGMCVFGGADCFRDSFGDMAPVLNDVARRYRPDVALLPISKVEINYRQGGINGFCRCIDRDGLDRTVQYTSGPSEAAEWARLSSAAVVVPYAAFVLSRRTAPGNFGAFRREMRSLGLASRIRPMVPFAHLRPNDLSPGLAVRSRCTMESAFILAVEAVHRARRRIATARRFADPLPPDSHREEAAPCG